MKKISLKLTVDSLAEIKNCCENLKNCTSLKPELCIALQRNFKTAKAKLDEIQEDLNLLRDNYVEATKTVTAEKKTEVDKGYTESIKKKVKELSEVELYVFLQADFPGDAAGFGSKEVVIQSEEGKSPTKTQFQFYEVYLPLIDLIVFDAYSD
jgi:hypothetical protein